MAALLRLAGVTLLVAALLASGCTAGGGASDDGGPTDAETVALPVKDSFDLSLGIHCGIRFAEVHGETWATRYRDDGNGNPPKAWSTPGSTSLGRMYLLSSRLAVFVSSGHPPLYFRPFHGVVPGCA